MGQNSDDTFLSRFCVHVKEITAMSKETLFQLLDSVIYYQAVRILVRYS